MSKIVSTRLNEDEIALLNEVAQLEHLDRSTLLHKIIIDKILEIKMKKMAQLYQKGALSLQEAATASNVSLYEMMEYVEREKVIPLEPSNEELEENFQKAQKTLKRSNFSSKLGIQKTKICKRSTRGLNSKLLFFRVLYVS